MMCLFCFSSDSEARKRLRYFRFYRTIFGVASVILFCSMVYWLSNHASLDVDATLVTESWEVVNDGSHNAFTDLIDWKNNFYLVYRSAPSHLDFHSKLVILRSPNARSWEKLTELTLDGEDIRDPKLAVIENRLFLYALKNVNRFALPYSTVYSSSENGKTWQPWQMVEPQGWLFWRPKTNDGLTWYVPAYSSQHDQTALFQSQDGKKWEKVSVIDANQPQSEVEITFADNNRLTAIIRLESRPFSQESSSSSTLISSAGWPFKTWSGAHSLVTRLDGPAMFTDQNNVFAAGRSEPDGGILFGARGGLFNKKRTSIFAVTAAGLREMTDLPSQGDTSYPGIVIRGDEGYISYYTNDTHYDFPWLIGQFLPTSIRIAKINLPALKRAATTPP